MINKWVARIATMFVSFIFTAALPPPAMEGPSALPTIFRCRQRQSLVVVSLRHESLQLCNLNNETHTLWIMKLILLLHNHTYVDSPLHLHFERPTCTIIFIKRRVSTEFCRRSPHCRNRHHELYTAHIVSLQEGISLDTSRRLSERRVITKVPRHLLLPLLRP